MRLGIALVVGCCVTWSWADAPSPHMSTSAIKDNVNSDKPALVFIYPLFVVSVRSAAVLSVAEALRVHRPSAGPLPTLRARSKEPALSASVQRQQFESV